jgi:RNA polymerase sigma-70 factor (ECF subfamily)
MATTLANAVAQHLPYLTRIVRKVVRGDQMAEDIVQETVLKALTNADQFRFESALKTWLTCIAINEARQAYRCAWHRRSVPLITENFDLDRTQLIHSPNNDYEAKEREALIRNAVSRLPQTYRSVVELCDLQQVPMSDAASKLGLTLPAVKARRHRARQKLLRILRHQPFEDAHFVRGYLQHPNTAQKDLRHRGEGHSQRRR